MNQAKVKDLQTQLEDLFTKHGFELHPFLVGWYNEQVSPKFHLSFPPDTLAFVVISQPAMFEKAFLPFLTSESRTGLNDPIDECMMHYFSKVHEKFPSVTIMHDFQLNHTRRPKVLVQTAGHVSGAVRFLRAEDYPELGDKKYYPVCHHPVWGGWFALRGVLIFSQVSAVLDKMEPSMVLSNNQAVEMIRLYNECWQDWRWRDVGREGGEKYSDIQIKYFETLPCDRLAVIDDIVGTSVR